jgi:hypothetical protein
VSHLKFAPANKLAAHCLQARLVGWPNIGAVVDELGMNAGTTLR